MDDKLGIVLQAKLDENASLIAINKQIRRIQKKLDKLTVKVSIDISGAQDLSKILKDLNNINKQQENNRKKITRRRMSDEDAVLGKLYQKDRNNQIKIGQQRESILNRLYERDYRNQIKIAQQRQQEELNVARIRERASLDAENNMARFRQKYSNVNYDEGELKRILNIEERLNRLRREGRTDTASINHEIQIMNREMREFENRVRESQTQMRNLQRSSSSISSVLKRFVQFYIVGDIFSLGERAIRSMYETVRDLDSAMIELRKVTDETDNTYSRFLDNSSKKAAELGSTTKDVVDATTEFARMGSTFTEAQDLASSAIIYTKVGDNIDAQSAAQVLISTMAAFKTQGLESIDVIDKLNNISNKYSITSDGLGEALKRSASAMHEANNSLDETIALITAANTISQDPEMVG